jgi:hypothetical protein
MGGVPLVWLAMLRVTGRVRAPGWWCIAGAFAVSWVADGAAHWIDPDIVGNLYPLTQASMTAVATLHLRDSGRMVAVFIVAALASVLWTGPRGFDVLLRCVAFGSVAGIAYASVGWGLLRPALLIYFGAGLAAWLAYAASPSWGTYLCYQWTRALGIALFCVAATTGVNR